MLFRSEIYWRPSVQNDPEIVQPHHPAVDGGSLPIGPPIVGQPPLAALVNRPAAAADPAGTACRPYIKDNARHFDFVERMHEPALEPPACKHGALNDDDHRSRAKETAQPGRRIPEQPSSTDTNILEGGSGQRYVIRGCLGSGAFGRVMCAENSACEYFAVKILSKKVQYSYQYGRHIALLEKAIACEVAEQKKPFLVNVEETWSDRWNIYFIMASVSLRL